MDDTFPSFVKRQAVHVSRVLSGWPSYLWVSRKAKHCMFRCSYTANVWLSTCNAVSNPIMVTWHLASAGMHVLCMFWTLFSLHIYSCDNALLFSIYAQFNCSLYHVLLFYFIQIMFLFSNHAHPTYPPTQLSWCHSLHTLLHCRIASGYAVASWSVNSVPCLGWNKCNFISFCATAYYDVVTTSYPLLHPDVNGLNFLPQSVAHSSFELLIYCKDPQKHVSRTNWQQE